MKRISIKFLRKLTKWRIKANNNYYLFVVLSIVTGFLTGLAAVILKNGVHFFSKFLMNNTSFVSQNISLLILPIIGLILTNLFIRFSKLHVGSGIPKLLSSVTKNRGFLKPHNIFSSVLTSILTVGFGGSVGLESPTVATGGGIASSVSRAFKLTYRQRILLLGVASAGTIAAIFKAPVAGIIFALEVIMIDLTTMSVIPIVLASVTASLTSYMFLGANVLYPVHITSLFEIKDVPYYIILGVFTGFFALYFSNVYMKITKGFSKIKKNYMKILVGGVTLGVLIFIFPALYGEGYVSLNMALSGDFSFLYENIFLSSFEGKIWSLIILFIVLSSLKVVAAGVTVGAGGIGGVFAPALFVGANLGLFLSFLMSFIGMHIAPENSALVGMSALVAGLLHAPLTSVFFIGEITGGYQLLIPLLISSTISYIIVRIFHKNSIYTLELANENALLTHHTDRNILTILDMKKLIETNFITVGPEKKLGDLVDIVQIATRDLFPVIDCENNFLGVVSLNRIRKIMFRAKLYDKISVTELMIFPQTFVESDEHLLSVAEKFEKTQRYNLLVLDKGKYVGFLSRSHFFSQYRQLLRDFSAD